MIERNGEHRKRYVDHPKDIPKPTCLIHGPRHSSDECKVLGDFGSKYAKSRPTNDRRQDPANGNKFNRRHEKNAIFNHTVYGILMQEYNKVSAEEVENKNIESEIVDNDIYQIDNMSLDDKK